MGEILSGLIDIELRPQGGQTLTRQLYQQLRAAILKGALPPGHRLPSSRDLARPPAPSFAVSGSIAAVFHSRADATGRG